MSEISVYGAGAFGTALAIVLAETERKVSLVPRNTDHQAAMQISRTNEHRLPGVRFPKTMAVSDASQDPSSTCLIAVPMQSLSEFLSGTPALAGATNIITCCKGIDLNTGLGPTAIVQNTFPDANAGILSGPSFAVDIAGGLPTALTLAMKDPNAVKIVQHELSTTTLRLYRTDDVTGVEIGGALKNVVAIAAGISIGAGLGESARAAIITRGYAEMLRFAVARGAKAETLAGLSGFGDLVLTCTSAKSRNYSFGLDLGAGKVAKKGVTVEGVATAQALAKIAKTAKLDLPITRAISALLDNKSSVAETIQTLMSRPLKKE